MDIDVGYKNIINRIKQYQNDDYYKLVYKYPMSFYNERVEMVGFKDFDKVLDVGCGYGQWSIALSEKNRNVVAIDHSDNMLKVTEIMKEYYAKNNIDIQEAKLPVLNFDNEEFDAIWCWGVLMFLNREEMLKEFYRVLKPGGRVLIGGKNAKGRWLFKAVKSIKDRNKKRFIKATQVLIRGKNMSYRPNYTNLKDIERVYEPFGFKIIAKDFDGHIDLDNKKRIREIFNPRYFFLENNIEFILEKQK